ncbi:hypothetical protein AgCh_012860 [Apium graveolens]
MPDLRYSQSGRVTQVRPALQPNWACCAGSACVTAKLGMLRSEVVSTNIKGLQRMRNKASTDVSKASTDNIHQRMSASTDKASTANASTDKASMDKASTDESFNGCLVQ